jgi:hypothetical protein
LFEILYHGRFAEDTGFEGIGTWSDLANSCTNESFDDCADTNKVGYILRECLFFWEKNCNRYALWDFYLFEEIFTLIIIVIVLEISRRVVGLGMPLIATFFLIHMFFAKYFPGFMY